MSDDLDKLVAVFNLQKYDENTFIGSNVPARLNQIFGGQILAQALSAALYTVPHERIAHSLHSYFIRLGKPDTPLLFRVENIRDGGSFNTRRVVAHQNEQPIFISALSFQTKEEGHNFQATMPSVIQPEALVDDLERLTEMLKQHPERFKQIDFLPVECRHVSPIDWLAPKRQSSETGVWLRAKGKLPDSPHIHQAMLAYLSDLYLYGASLRPHALSIYMQGMQPASLDHTIWFHAEFRADEWLYYQLESSWTGNARGLNFGKFFTRDGRLVASTAQEGLMRIRNK